MRKEFTTILIDMYGVILEESRGNIIPYSFEHLPLEEQKQFMRRFDEEQLFIKANSGEISSDTFLTLLGYTDPQYHMKNYLENYLTLDAGFTAFAEKFYQKYEIVLVSNDVSEWSTFLTEYHGINKFFKCKIISGDVKCSKPERKIYELTLEKLGRRPEECIYVDNSTENLGSAESLGIYPILFNRDGERYSGDIVNNFAELTELLEK